MCGSVQNSDQRQRVNVARSGLRGRSTLFICLSNKASLRFMKRNLYNEAIDDARSAIIIAHFFKWLKNTHLSAVGPLFETTMGKNDTEPERKDATVTPEVITMEASAIAPTVTLDQVSIVINRIDKLVIETRNGVVLAIAATFLTAFAIGLETWIGPVGVIMAIILIGVIVTVSLYLLWLRPKAGATPS